MGERALSKLQFGLEGTRGTAVAADTVLLGTHPPVSPDRQIIFPDEDIGVRGSSTRTIVGDPLVRNTITIPHGYYQILPVLFSCSVKGNITPVEQTGAQSDYLWTFSPSLTAANAPDTITLEMGDNTQAYEVEYVMFDRIRLSGTIAQDDGESAVAIEAGYFGRQLTATSFTGSLQPATVEPMAGALARLYKDALFANAGSTELTSTLRGWDIEILSGVHHKKFGSAVQYFDTHGEGTFMVSASFVLEGNASADAIWDDYRANTKRAVRFAISGSQIGTGVNYNLTLDIFGQFHSVTPLFDDDRGNNLTQANFRGVVDNTAAAYDMFDLTVITNQSAI